MKKLLLIYLLLIGIVSCTDQGTPQIAQDGQEKVELSVMVPDAQLHSRALTEHPVPFTNLYLAVFDEAGYLMEYRQANPVDANQNENHYGYTVSLTPSPSPVTIHFIANAPTTLNFGSETEVISQLYTSAGGDAYWQRVEFPEGLKLNETSVKNKLTGVRLIRNFAWIHLVLKNTITSDKFILEKYCVVNTRDRGSMAPYNTTKGAFESYPAGSNTTHTMLVSNGYDGFIPQGAELVKTIPDETKWAAAENGFFIYERETPRTDPLFILMKGKYNGSTTSSYYKIDLRDNSNNYFPVLRNFRYQVEIQNIEHEGHETALGAAQGAGSGDVSTSIETVDYTNISNSIARIFVSYTDTTLVTNNPITLKYKFLSFETKDQNNNTIPGAILNGENVTITEETVGDDKKVIQTWSKKLNNGTLVVDKDGWSTIEIQPVAPDGTTRVQKLTIVGTVMINGKTYTLQRQVKFNLKNKDHFSLLCNPNAVPNTQGSAFDLFIKIPGGLGSSMFPLDFDIEAVEQSITPAQGDNLPVITRKSIVPTKANKTTIGFMKSVSWEEYDGTDNVGGYKSIPCHFKTNKAESATVIWAQNKYFNNASTTLGNYTPKQFQYLAFSKPSVNPENPDVQFTFNMSSLPSLGNVTVTLVGLVPDADDNLIPLGGNTYSYTPPTTGTQTLYLKTTINSGQASVTLEAYQFVTATSEPLNVSNKERFVIDNGYEVSIGTSLNQGRYPRKIYNGGTETVTVKIGTGSGSSTYEITINGTQVVNGLDIEMKDGWKDNTTVTFTFEDSVWRNYNGWGWSSGEREFEYQCTLKDIMDRKTITFPAQD